MIYKAPKSQKESGRIDWHTVSHRVEFFQHRTVVVFKPDSQHKIKVCN